MNSFSVVVALIIAAFTGSKAFMPSITRPRLSVSKLSMVVLGEMRNSITLLPFSHPFSLPFSH